MPDRETLLPMLRASQAAFTASFAGLPPEAFHFRPADGGWSIAETAEHVALVEVGSGKLMRGRMVRQPTPPELLEAARDGDERVDARLLVRNNPFEAPDFVRPTGQWQTPDEIIAVFSESRGGTIDFLETTELDLGRYAAPHPVLGPLTGLQWAYFLVRHTARHVEQIEEVKQDARYPG